MKNVIFSIGLNVGASEPADQLQKTLHFVANTGGTVRDLAIGRADWQGVPERFVQVCTSVARTAQAYSMAELYARELNQECVAVLKPNAGRWRLVHADGRLILGNTLTQSPVILADSDTHERLRAARPSRNDHSGIQAHSMGDVFPAVIARLERDGEYAGHELTIGAWREVYSSYDDAYEVARYVCQHGAINSARLAEVSALEDYAHAGRVPDRFASSRAVDLGGRN